MQRIKSDKDPKEEAKSKIADEVVSITYPQIKMDKVSDDLILREYLDGNSHIIDEMIDKEFHILSPVEYRSLWDEIFELAFKKLKIKLEVK